MDLDDLSDFFFALRHNAPSSLRDLALHLTIVHTKTEYAQIFQANLSLPPNLETLKLEYSNASCGLAADNYYDSNDIIGSILSETAASTLKNLDLTIDFSMANGCWIPNPNISPAFQIQNFAHLNLRNFSLKLLGSTFVQHDYFEKVSNMWPNLESLRLYEEFRIVFWKVGERLISILQI